MRIDQRWVCMLVSGRQFNRETVMSKLIFRSLVLVSFALGLTACNTVKGVGKDIKTAGEKIEQTAEKHD